MRREDRDARGVQKQIKEDQKRTDEVKVLRNKQKGMRRDEERKANAAAPATITISLDFKLVLDNDMIAALVTPVIAKLGNDRLNDQLDYHHLITTSWRKPWTYLRQITSLPNQI